MEVQSQEMQNIVLTHFQGARELWSMPNCHMLSVEKYSLWKKLAILGGGLLSDVFSKKHSKCPQMTVENHQKLDF